MVAVAVAGLRGGKREESATALSSRATYFSSRQPIRQAAKGSINKREHALSGLRQCSSVLALLEEGTSTAQEKKWPRRATLI